jgi:hypothetical protein
MDSQSEMIARETLRASEVRLVPGWGTVMKFADGSGMHVPEEVWMYVSSRWRAGQGP